MATFFIDPYSKYHDKLIGATGMVSSASSLKEKASYAVSTSSTLSSQINSALWTEQGKSYLLSNNLPSLNKLLATVEDNISNGLVKAVDIAINSLLPTVVELKKYDELYEETKKKLDSLVEPPRYETRKKLFGGTETVESDAYKKYIKEKTELEKLLKEYETKCKQCQTQADSDASSINGLNSLVALPKVTSASMNGVNKDGVKEYFLSGDMEISHTDFLINYGEYYVINSSFPVIDYYNHIQEHGLYQDATTDYRNKCLGVADFYGRDLYVGSSKNNIESAYSGGETWYTMVDNVDEQDTLRRVYEELSAGRPVSMNVKGPTYRHWVTVVGFKTDVTSADDLKAEDLLILDSWDGKIERMDCDDSRKFVPGYECGHSNYNWRVDVLKDVKYQYAGTGKKDNSATA